MKPHTLSLFLGTGALGLLIYSSTACSPDQSSNPGAQPRIQAFENGLQALSEKPSEPNAPAPQSSTLAERMAFYKVPGVSLAVINDGRIEWAREYGEITAGSAKPVTSETLFEAASTTKALAAAAVLHYVEAGRLDLDADVNLYLKSWKVPESPFTLTEKVTLRRLLTHRAGLPMTNMGYDEKAGAPTLLQVVKGEAPAENKAAIPEMVPGSQWRYSNVGFALVQLVLEETLGQDLESILSDVVFSPLGMTSSTVVYPLPATWRKREAMPHDENGQAAAPAMHPSALAQGGLMTTPSDLARFLVELLESYHGASSRLLSRETTRTMFHPAVALDPRLFGFELGDALGVFVKGEGSALTVLHPGNNFPGSICWLIGFPERRQGAIIMLNGNNGEALAFEIISALGRMYGWPPLM